VGPSLSSPPPAAALAGVHSPNAPGRTHGAAPLVSRPRPRPWHGSIQLIPEATASAEAPPAQRPFTERGSRLPRLPAPLVAVPLVRSRARGGRPASIPYSSGRCASSAGRHRPVGRAVGLALVPRAGAVRHGRGDPRGSYRYLRAVGSLGAGVACRLAFGLICGGCEPAGACLRREGARARARWCSPAHLPERPRVRLLVCALVCTGCARWNGPIPVWVRLGAGYGVDRCLVWYHRTHMDC